MLDIIYRFVKLLPQILWLLTLIIILKGYFRYFEESEAKDIKDINAFCREKRLKSIIISILTLIDLVSCEELLYRTLIIILFAKFSILSWIGIIISSILFAKAHYKDHLFIETWDEITETIRNDSEKKKLKRVRTVFSFCAGILLGYIGVRYQSLYIVTIVHIIWDAIVPLIIINVLLIIFLIIVKVIDIIEKLNSVK